MPASKRGRPSSAMQTAAGHAQDEAAGPGPGSTASGIVALHRSRLFDWKPSAVAAIAPCPGAPLFAVGYESGSIELWDMLQLVCTQTVVGPPLELTSLAWARDTASSSWRTFAAFLDGSLAEVVWHQAAVAHSMDSYGGVVWALAASPAAVAKPGFAHTLAAACDDGSVRLFGCEGGEPGLVPERVLARLEGRLLTCAWHAGGTTLAVAGTSGNIHLLDAVTGREQLRITASAATSRPVTVWHLVSLPDGTLVSGDSDGATQMWDGRFGSLLSRFSQHKADVLALAAAEDGCSVFAAGVDSQVAMFTRVLGSAAAATPDSWAFTNYKRPHTHDVRALALLAGGPDRDPVLLSGGVDAQLIAYPVATFVKEHPTRLCRCPQRPACQAAAAAASASTTGARPRLLITQHDMMDVWQLATPAPPPLRHGPMHGRGQVESRGPGHARDGEPMEGEPLELVAGPRHLARVNIKGARIASASLSPAGTLLACTTPAGTRMYRLEEAGGGGAGAPLRVVRLRLPAAAEEPAVAVTAIDDGVVLALPDGSMLSYKLSADGGAEVVTRTKPPPTATQPTGDAQAWRRYCPPAAQLTAAADGSLLAAVGRDGITLRRLPGLEPHGRTLHVDGAITALAFSVDHALLAATTSGCQLLVWDTQGGNQLAWCQDNAEEITAAVSRLPGTPTGISFCPAPPPAAAAAAAAAQPTRALPYRLVVSGPGGLVHFDLSKPVSNTYLELKAARRQRGPVRPEHRPQPEDRPESRGSNGRVIRTMHPAVWVGHVGPAELLLLEKPWEEVLAALPPPLFTHRYGT